MTNRSLRLHIAFLTFSALMAAGLAAARADAAAPPDARPAHGCGPTARDGPAARPRRWGPRGPGPGARFTPASGSCSGS